MIEDLDVAPAVADQAGALQQAGGDGHGGAAHSEHLSEELLRQRDDVASLNRIRQIIAVNLPRGLLVVVIGGSGRCWG